MHTEEEAKKLWCPHVVASHSDPRRVSKHDSDGDYSLSDTIAGAPGNNCIASKCMAWRWDPGSFSYPPTPDNPGGGPHAAPEEYRGFCGLAGRPD